MKISFIPSVALHRVSCSSSSFTEAAAKRNGTLVSRASLDSDPTDVRHAIVVGAGVAGLTAAKHLANAHVPVVILEASDDVGGRIRSDVVEGYILDRGFQVFIEAYPQCSKACVSMASIGSSIFIFPGLFYFAILTGCTLYFRVLLVSTIKALTSNDFFLVLPFI